MENTDNQTMPWEEKAIEEARQLGAVLWGNFKHALDLVMKHVPDPTKPDQRAKAFGIVAEHWLGATVNPIASFANTTPEIEEEVVKAIRAKFQWIRQHEKELQLARLDAMSEDRKNNSGLVLAPTQENN